jgi:hypothetical protein
MSSCPQGPVTQVSEPHEAPSVERVQLCVSVRLSVAQPPPRHTGTMHVRVCVPVVAHVDAKPLHALHALHVSVPQDTPSVVRVHACDSVDISLAHVPLRHTGVVQVRVCVALVAQVELQPHAP